MPVTLNVANAAPRMSPVSTAFAILATAATSLNPASPAALATAPNMSPRSRDIAIFAAIAKGAVGGNIDANARTGAIHEDVVSWPYVLIFILPDSSNDTPAEVIPGPCPQSPK